ncbi:MAG: sensor histidine kinase [Bdellovibrionota bacterium]
MDADATKEKIILLAGDKNSELFSYVNENFKDYQIKVVSSFEDCFRKIDGDDTKIIIVNKNTENWEYEYFISKVKLTINSPNVIVVSNKVNDALYINSLYLSGFSSYLITTEKDWKNNLHSIIRHLIRNQKLEEINRKLTARLTEANMMLGEKNKRLDEFCTTIAHDIRGPLGSLVMKLDYIKDNYEIISEDRLRALLNTSLTVCEKLISQVQAMYDFAKLGKEATKMEFFNLNELILSLIEEMDFSSVLNNNLNSSLDNKLDNKLDDKINIKLNIKLDSGSNVKFTIDNFPDIYGSKELIRRLFLNLLTNAIKYNDKKEKIINISFKGIETMLAGKFAKIYVEDNGNGILKEDLTNIFKLFNRAGEARSKKEGLGIGLAVVDRVIELHLGKIQIKSQIGKGSLFEFTLPVEKM